MQVLTAAKRAKHTADVVGGGQAVHLCGLGYWKAGQSGRDRRDVGCDYGRGERCCDEWDDNGEDVEHGGRGGILYFVISRWYKRPHQGVVFAMTTHAEKILAIDKELAALLEYSDLCSSMCLTSLTAGISGVVTRSAAKRRRSNGRDPLDTWQRQAMEADRSAVEGLLLKLHRWIKHGTLIPKALFKQEVSDKFATLATVAKNKSDAWVGRNSDLRKESGLVTKLDVDDDRENINEYYPAIYYKESETIQGFEFLQFGFTRELDREWGSAQGHSERPTHVDGQGTFHTLYSYTVPAMLVSSTIERFNLPIKNVHVICKGFREFNQNDIIPKFQNEALIWYVDTDDVKNLDIFVQSVVESEAFELAVHENNTLNPIRRIVVWIMLKGHMEAFCWDQLYDDVNEVVCDVLYIMTNMSQEDFAFDTHIHEHITEAFKKALKAKGLIDDEAKVIYDLKCARNLRRSMITNTEDIACVMFTAFSTLILSTVLDIQEWDGEEIDKRFWNFCRAGYAKFEKELIEIIERLTSEDKAIWICPNLRHKHVNIKDVHLITVDRGNVKRKLTYDWNNYWTESALT